MTITAATTRPELEEAMRNVVATLRRLPAHWTERRASYHDILNHMLDQWEMTP